MRDVYLNAPSKEALRSFLLERGFKESEGHLYHERVAFDEVGEITKTTHTSGEGEDAVYDSYKLYGYHANLRILDPSLYDNFKEYEVTPQTPERVWA